MRYSQPPSPRVDRGHPLARGLTGAIIPPFATRIAQAVYAVGKAGRGFTTPTDANHWRASSKSLVSVYPQWTLLVVAQGVVSSGGNTFCERPSDNQILKLGRDGTNHPQLVLRNSAGAGLLFLTASTSAWINNENPNTVVVTQRGTQDHKLYVNGVQEASDVTTNTPHSFNECEAFIGRDPQDSGEALAGASVPLVLTWSRALSDGEIAAVSRNPWQIFYGVDRIWPVSASGDVSAALTGVAGTGAVGTVGPQTAKSLTGNVGTGAAGTVTPTTSKALTGNAGTGSVGSVTPVRAGALTGNAGTGAAGTVVSNVTVALTGNQATGAVGDVSATSSKTLTGVAATGTAGAVSPGVTVALTGVSATGTAGSVTAGADATQALTGVSGTGAAGVVGPSITIALTGVSGTGAVGSVTAGQPLTGVAGTGSVGTVAPSTSMALTGIAAAGALGSVGPDITIALSGVEAAGQVGTVSFVSGDITIALTGVQATGEVGVLAVAGEFTEIAAAVWSYVLSNGKTAGQNVVEIRAMLDVLSPGFWNFVIEGTYTAADLLRVIAAVQAGKSTITALGGGAATVEFRAVDDSETRVTATMDGSERTEVTLNVD